MIPPESTARPAVRNHAELGAETETFLRRLREGQDPKSAMKGAIDELLPAP